MNFWKKMVATPSYSVYRREDINKDGARLQPRAISSSNLHRSEKYKFHEDGLFFVTLTIVGWIDLFTRKEYCDEIILNLTVCIAKKGLRVYAFCIMPSHIHMVCDVESGEVGPIMRDFKSYTAKQVLRLIQENTGESRKAWLLYLFRYFAKQKLNNYSNAKQCLLEPEHLNLL